ncbi:methyltransferase domain-containing protein [Rutstroemia sp. NJR-2017a WRK4]|nr:methyltransferase domain-containing protein [Rutstroemia sp. NJR-2017a WRK4]
MPSNKIVKAVDPKTYVYYIPLSKRPPTRGFRDLLEEYSYVHADDIDTHLNTIRDLAYTRHPLPSIGLFTFATLTLCGDDLPVSQNPVYYRYLTREVYPRILRELVPGGGRKYLDIGVGGGGWAPDLRRLVWDGAEVGRCWVLGGLIGEGDEERGVDGERRVRGGDSREWGWGLWGDEDIIDGERFVRGWLTDKWDGGETGEEEGSRDGLEWLRERGLLGEIDIINFVEGLDNCGWEEQIRMCERIITILKKERGSLVVGRCAGHRNGMRSEKIGIGWKKEKSKGKEKGRAVEKEEVEKEVVWEHNEESFTEMWKEAGRRTSSEWSVNTAFWRWGVNTKTGEPGWFRGEDNGVVSFVCERL